MAAVDGRERDCGVCVRVLCRVERRGQGCWRRESGRREGATEGQATLYVDADACQTPTHKHTNTQTHIDM